jgi:hypothetical protein
MTTNFSTPNTLFISEMVFPRAVVDHFVQTYDPSKVGVDVGEIQLITSTTAAACRLESLLVHSENKPCDIIIFCSMNTQERTDYLNFVERAPVPTPEESTAAKMKHLTDLSVVLCTYLMHGSLQGLAQSPPQVPKFALQVTKEKQEHYAMSRLCSVKSFVNAKFVKFFDDWDVVSEALPETLRSRLALGLAGNRVRTILKLIKAKITDDCFDGSDIEGFANDDFLMGTALISLHPDHPQNQMGNVTKGLLARAGDIWKKSGRQLNDLYALSPGLFIKGVQDAMDAEPALIPLAEVSEEQIATMCAGGMRIS